ncbi:MAG: Type II secretion system protein E [Pelotomaculum sp. PtaU1.Bin035]|nr:MAG: Type II secretion system protein E [Pelotomaculum sp. PtaU1.Bin035]
MAVTLKASKKLSGEDLVLKGIITREQLWEALRLQSRTGEFLGSILIKLGMVSEETMDEILGVQQNRLDNIEPVLLKAIPEQLVRRHKVIPLKNEGNCLTVAMVDPMDVLAIDDLRLLTGCEIEPVQVDEKDILAVIQKHFGILEVDRIFEEYELLTGQQETEAEPLEEEVIDEAPIVRLVNSIFLQAIEQNASDIHIEPQRHQVRVRYRIDGMLREMMLLPKKICSAVISRVKIISNMDISVKRIPQDGRFQLKFGTREIDLRVSTLPTVYGEKVVTRLLDRSMKSCKIEQIGFGTLNLRRFTSALKSSHGMLLITGPTGSGKTTTLYAALNEINTVEKNIITVEDPVEYILEGINQTQVNIKAGMTFAASLRAILRQDPDIIMVGEIRDSETAEIAVKAATTGHLVLSTLHTNAAAGAITRLVDMGIEPFLVASSVLAAVAQRLVRLICPECRQAYMLAPDAPERTFIGFGPEKPVTLYKGTGCDNCGNIGYRGRMAIHEVLPMTASLRPLIIRNAPTDEIKQKALAEGMISLKMDGIHKALAGLTTIDEVMRVAYTDEI